MSETSNRSGGKVEAFPALAQAAVAMDELNRLLELLRREFPEATKVHFEFDGRLHVHVDVRESQQVSTVEARLPKLNGGMFTEIRHGKTPGRVFLHRISALVAR